jgi:hypothetical protein
LVEVPTVEAKEDGYGGQGTIEGTIEALDVKTMGLGAFG